MSDADRLAAGLMQPTTPTLVFKRRDKPHASLRGEIVAFPEVRLGG